MPQKGIPVPVTVVEFVLLQHENALWFWNNHKRRRWLQKGK